MKWWVAEVVILSFGKPLRKKLTHLVCKLLRPGHNPWSAKEELEKKSLFMTLFIIVFSTITEERNHRKTSLHLYNDSISPNED